jgi:hypothetical protein
VVEWQGGGVRVRCEVRDGALLVSHNWQGGGVQTVALISSAANLGGRRWWFRCPACGARVHRLHLPGRGTVVREFKCRACHNLSYESAQGSRGFGRAFFLMRARELGSSYRAARDDFRRTRGGHLYEPRQLSFP